MFVRELILCAIFVKITIADDPSHPKPIKIQPRDDFEFSSEDITNNTYVQKNTSVRRTAKNKTSTSLNPKERPEEQVSNLLKEVGSTLPQKVYKKTYNESAKTKICWRARTYVRDNLVTGGKFPWREFEIVFDFPDTENPRNIEHNDKEIRTYKVKDPDSGTAELLNFTIIEKNATFTLSKNEKISCGTGNFLSKTYFEWPKSNRKRVVVKLSEKPDNDEDELMGHNLTEQDDDIKQKPDVDNERFPLEHHKNPAGGSKKSHLGDQDQVIESDESEERNDPKPEAYTGDDNKTFRNKTGILDNESENTNFPDDLEISNVVDKHHKRRKNIKDDSRSHKSPSEQKRLQTQDDYMDLAVGASVPRGIDQSFEDNNREENDDIFIVPEKKGNPDAMATSKGAASRVDPCSPILATLLSGNGLFPGLCTLRKNEKVVLKGDITVSKKYLNRENDEVVEPLYTIRENTEIKAVPDKLV